MNWKTTGLIGIATAAIVYATVKHNRYPIVDKSEWDELVAEADGPLFEVGDKVIVTCPYMTEMWGADSDFMPRVYEVAEVRYINRTDAYVYRIIGDERWYNENWLVKDTYGSMTVDPDAIEHDREVVDEYQAEAQRAGEQKAKSDELLDEYNRTGNDEVKREWTKRSEVYANGGDAFIADILTDNEGSKSDE